MTELCEFCQDLKPVAYTDSVGRTWCAECYEMLTQGQSPIWEFLALTIPFQVGDRVECRTAGRLYDGIGTVQEISTDPANYGTPVYPSFRVAITDKAYPTAPDEIWYTEKCLVKLDKEMQDAD